MMKQEEIYFPTEAQDLFTIRQASEWASQYLNKNITPSNISYLIQYGRVPKIGNNGNVMISKIDLIGYYESSYLGKKETDWKNKLGDDLNWALSFDYLKEAETTKHVHRLHPYKGKFIPQLVEYFLDDHVDDFKKEIYFKQGDIVLDPFCGSGTTLVQANELGMHAVGIDISAFNALISNVKTDNYDFSNLEKEIQDITKVLKKMIAESDIPAFETELAEKLTIFNNSYFPSPEFRYKVIKKEIDEKTYSYQKEQEFLKTYFHLIEKYKVRLKQPKSDNFLDKWYLYSVRNEIDFAFNLVKEIKDSKIKKVIAVILSRTIRSCRATTHADLATLKEPVSTTYYCAKHGKICRPLFSILSWWLRYSTDTIKRLKEFDKLRTNTYQICLTGDSRAIDILESLEKKSPLLAQQVKDKKIKGIFSSPPYVGLINYHEQHAYAYDLFGFERKDDLEIGAMFKGQNKDAKENYLQGIVDVLNLCKKFLADDFDIFLVANDKNNLYPQIAEKAEMQIVNQFKRPVLNRTEKDKGAYSEIIFHLRSS